MSARCCYLAQEEAERVAAALRFAVVFTLAGFAMQSLHQYHLHQYHKSQS